MSICFEFPIQEFSMFIVQSFAFWTNYYTFLIKLRLYGKLKINFDLMRKVATHDIETQIVNLCSGYALTFGVQRRKVDVTIALSTVNQFAPYL